MLAAGLHLGVHHRHAGGGGQLPRAEYIYVGTEPTIDVAFNQPMDHKSVEAAFELKNADTGEVVRRQVSSGIPRAWPSRPSDYDYQPVRMKWRGRRASLLGVETMSFTPDKPLEFAATYRALVPGGSKGRKGAWALPKTMRGPSTPSSTRVSSAPTRPTARKQADPVGWAASHLLQPDESRFDQRQLHDPRRPSLQRRVYTYWWDSNTQLNISVRPQAQHRLQSDV